MDKFIGSCFQSLEDISGLLRSVFIVTNYLFWQFLLPFSSSGIFVTTSLSLSLVMMLRFVFCDSSLSLSFYSRPLLLHFLFLLLSFGAHHPPSPDLPKLFSRGISFHRLYSKSEILTVNLARPLFHNLFLTWATRNRNPA